MTAEQWKIRERALTLWSTGKFLSKQEAMEKAIEEKVISEKKKAEYENSFAVDSKEDL